MMPKCLSPLLIMAKFQISLLWVRAGIPLPKSNALLSASANSTSATASLPSTFYRALVKVFAKCLLALDKEKSSSQCLMTETTPLSSVLGDTISLSSVYRPTLSKGPPAGPFVSFFAECPTRHLAKLASFPSARVKTFSKPQIFVTASTYDIMTCGQVS
jgi:hypothetical protein